MTTIPQDSTQEQPRHKDKAYKAQKSREWRAANKERVSQFNKEYAEANRERLIQYRKARYEANKETLRQRNKEDYKRHQEARRQKSRIYHATHQEQRKEYQEATREQRRSAHLARRYGISAEEFNMMFSCQMGLCAICGQPPKEGKNLVTDHCHLTGNVRELLCDSCNLILGAAYDNPETLIKAAQYLKKHSM